MTILFTTHDGRKVVEGSATGPGVTVGATAAADVDVPIPLFELGRKHSIKLKSVTGLPDGVVLVGFSYPNVDTVRLRIFNTTAAAITIAVGAIAVEVEAIGV